MYWLLDQPRKLVTLNPKLKSTGAGRYQLLPVGGTLTASSWPRKTSLSSQDAMALQQIASVALYLWLIVVMSVRQSTVAAISGSPPKVMAVRAQRWQPDCKICASGRNGREIDAWAESPRLSPPGYLHHRSPVARIANHYRDNAITYKAQRDKNARELEAGERGNYWHADASAWCCCARCKIHEGWMDAGLEMMLCVMMLPLVVVGCIIKSSLSVAWSHHASGVDNAASPRLADTAERDYFTLRESKVDHYAKTTGRNPEVY